METIREVFSGTRIQERRSVVGALGNQAVNIYKDRIMTPHQVMEEVERADGNNPIFKSSINTVTDFIYGGDIIFKSDDKMTEVRGNQLIKDLKFDEWVPEAIRQTIKSGNGYVEMDFNHVTSLPHKFYPQAVSSRWYINSDDYGEPRKIKELVFDEETRQYTYKEIPNEAEYYIQELDPGIRYKNAKWFTMSYHMTGTTKFRTFRIYGIPIHRKKIIHFKLNLGTTGLYGSSHFSAALDDNEVLKQIERSIAVIARYKAVPRKVIMYGDKDMPASGEELDDFIIYLESLERDEDPVVNKAIKTEDLSYAGKDINLAYMIDHIRKKLFGGMIPDFLTGYGDQVNRATAQVQLVSFVLSIYSKRKQFLRKLEEAIINPWLKKEGLKEGHLEFSELDFETKQEKSSRVIQLFTANILPLNRSLELLGESKLGDDGDVYYTEWQNELMNKGMPGGGESPDEFGIGDEEGDVMMNQTPFQFPQDASTIPPENYSVYSEAFEIKHYQKGDSHVLPLKERLGDEEDEEGMISDPSGLDPLVMHTCLHIRGSFKEKLNQVKKFSSKRSLEVLKEDLRAKDVRELATFLRVGGGEIKPEFEKAVEQAWLKGSKDAGKKIGFESGIPTTIKKMDRVKKGSWNYVKKNLETGTEKVEDVLTKGIAGKVKGKELEKDVEEAYNFISWKSEQLAITELRKAYSQGQEHVMKNTPYKKWKWETSRDEKVCPICRPRHGRTYDVRNKLEFFPPAHPNCFTNSRVKILTSKGYKKIKDINVGDNVLTHDGTFKKVNRILDKKSYKGEVYKVKVGTVELSTTPEHPYLVNRNGREVWIQSKDIRKGDLLKIKAKRCKGCKTLIPDLQYSGSYCSLSCSNKYTALEQWKNPKNKESVSKKVSEWNKRRYLENPELKYSITRGANKKTREMVKEGTHVWQKKNRKFVPWMYSKNSERYKEITQKISWWKSRDGGNQARLGILGWTEETKKRAVEKTRQRMLSGDAARMCSMNRNPSKPQVELYEKVKEKYTDAILNHPIRIHDKKYFVLDVYVPSTKINYEYDGSYWHKYIQKEDSERDRILNEFGIDVVRIREGEQYEI